MKNWILFSDHKNRLTTKEKTNNFYKSNFYRHIELPQSYGSKTKACRVRTYVPAKRSELRESEGEFPQRVRELAETEWNVRREKVVPH